MHHRLIAVLTIACLAWAGGGCTNKWNRNSEEVLMPLQTGSVLHRRVRVAAEPEKRPKKKKKEASAPKPEAEPRATPAPEEESTPPPDRFR
jgi:hypothetical protein